ncbi:MAG: hypothetical protein M3Q71_07850 [Chloroflexota bacterium]|nr:hypothetical protein [Chloroflexota bacterium]
MDRQCKGANAAGQPCDAKPVRPSGWCYWHDPALEAERIEGRRKGGAARSNRARAKKRLPAESLTLQEVQGLLSVALKGVLAGRIEPGIANASANLARAIAAVTQVAELDARIRELEVVAGIADRRRA